jgi:hypothetical protein
VDRIFKLQCHIDELLSVIGNPEERCCSYMHLYGTSLSCAMIAAKRNQNVELATIAGLLHDIYEYTLYDRLEPLEHRPDHGIRNSELARRILAQLGVASEDETNTICGAIKNHGYKDEIHIPFDEVLKDADVFHKQINNIRVPVHPIHETRFLNLINEFGLTWHTKVATWSDMT